MTWILGFGILAGVLLGSGSARADAADCAAFGGTFVPGSPDECQISGPLTKSGTFSFDEKLHLLNGGVITIDTSTGLTLNVSGDFVMDAGSMIDGGNTDCFGPGQKVGYPITITAVNINLSGPLGQVPGAVIRSNSCSGGVIKLTATTNVDIDGLVESVGTESGTGAVQPPGGGPITVKAGCDLTVSDTGKLSSRGQDPGADLVHLEACTVEVYGIVESTGAAHGAPNSPFNHCANANRPDKPSNSTACIEIWSGSTIVIDSNAPHAGELNADIGFSGGGSGFSWIDIFANGKITISDGTNNPGFAVHANKILQGLAGTITVKSLGANIEANGNALQADCTHAGGAGGTLTVEAMQGVNLNQGTLYARGDFVATGGFGTGGKENIRSYQSSIVWQNGVGDVRPTGTGDAVHPVPAASRGVIGLTDCLAGNVDTTGSIFPWNGTTATTPSNFNTACAGAPTVNTSYVSLPICPSGLFCEQRAIKRGIKFFDFGGDGGPYNPGSGDSTLSNWEIHLFDSTLTVHLHTTTDQNGKYEFVVPPGTYTVCETLQPGWTQTFPSSGADCSAHGGGTFGYQITLVAGQVDEGNDFGNFKESSLIVCPEDPKAILTRTIDPTGTLHGGLPNHLTWNDAWLHAISGEVIGVFGNTVENVVLDGDKSLKITQCTLARVTAASNSLPVIDITTSGALTIVSPDTVGGTIGWLVESDDHDLKSIRANGASLYGVQVLGDSNRISWNDVSGNGVGIRVDGDGADLRGGTVSKNTGDGVVFTATAAGNSLQGATIQGNGGNGVTDGGTGDTIKSNKVGPNAGNGIAVSGTSNTIVSNTCQSNALDGILVTGPTNLLDSNKTNSNTGNGIHVQSGSGNKLKNNASNTGNSGSSTENGLAEYQMDVAGVNQGGNKADNIGIPKTSLPQKCPLFPGVGPCE